MARRSQPIAFMCERTAEYILIPALAGILRGSFKSSFPFWFWASREGSAVADLPAMVKLLAVFARRPKVLVPCDREITVKFGKVLFEMARKAQNLGIPLLAGVPLLSDLGGLACAPECWWFLVQNHSGSPEDVIHRIDLVDRRLVTVPQEGIEGPLSDEDLLNYVRSSARLFHWPEAVWALRELRERNGERYARFPFGAHPYRPFFFGLFDEELPNAFHRPKRASTSLSYRWGAAFAGGEVRSCGQFQHSLLLA